MLNLSQLVEAPAQSAIADEKISKQNSYTFGHGETADEAELECDGTHILIPVARVLEFCNKGILTKSGKEAYCTLTAPKGSIQHNGKVLNNIRFGMNVFVKVA